MAEGEKVVARVLWPQEEASQVQHPVQREGGKWGLLCSSKVPENPKEPRMGSSRTQSKSWVRGRPFIAGPPWALPTAR